MSQANTDGDGFMDPRSNITHALDAGQLYEDARTGVELTLVFLSDHIALMRDEDSGSHRMETRGQFERNVGGDRYKLQANTDGSTTTSAKLKKLQSLLDHYEDADGRKAEHKASALEEAVDLIENNGRPDDNETVDFESIDGIGPGTASNLRSKGYTVKQDVRSASKEELIDVGGMGEKNTERLLEHIDE